MCKLQHLTQSWPRDKYTSDKYGIYLKRSTDFKYDSMYVCIYIYTLSKGMLGSLGELCLVQRLRKFGAGGPLPVWSASSRDCRRKRMQPGSRNGTSWIDNWLQTRNNVSTLIFLLSAEHAPEPEPLKRSLQCHQRQHHS